MSKEETVKAIEDTLEEVMKMAKKFGIDPTKDLRHFFIEHVVHTSVRSGLVTEEDCKGAEVVVSQAKLDGASFLTMTVSDKEILSMPVILLPECFWPESITENPAIKGGFILHELSILSGGKESVVSDSPEGFDEMVKDFENLGDKDESIH